MKNDRSSKSRDKPVRSKAGAAPARGGPRKPTTRTYGDAPPRRASARPAREPGSGADPYKPARRPAGDFTSREESAERLARAPRPPIKARAGSGERASYGDRKPFGERKSFGERKPYGERKSYGESKPYGERKSFGERKPYADRKSYADRKPFGERKPYGDRAERPSFSDRATRGFTVTLDPDIARVFRGDASVNRALRLVLQLMQVVEGPPPRADRPQRGYQGSAEARGFERKPRFAEDDVEAADVSLSDDSGVDADEDGEGTE